VPRTPAAAQLLGGRRRAFLDAIRSRGGLPQNPRGGMEGGKRLLRSASGSGLAAPAAIVSTIRVSARAAGSAQTGEDRKPHCTVWSCCSRSDTPNRACWAHAPPPGTADVCMAELQIPAGAAGQERMAPFGGGIGMPCRSADLQRCVWCATLPRHSVWGVGVLRFPAHDASAAATGISLMKWPERIWVQ